MSRLTRPEVRERTIELRRAYYRRRPGSDCGDIIQGRFRIITEHVYADGRVEVVSEVEERGL